MLVTQQLSTSRGVKAEPGSLPATAGGSYLKGGGLGLLQVADPPQSLPHPSHSEPTLHLLDLPPSPRSRAQLPATWKPGPEVLPSACVGLEARLCREWPSGQAAEPAQAWTPAQLRRLQ